MAKIISNNIPVGQCTIYSLQCKNGKGHDILLLHGAKFQAATWEKLATLKQLVNAGYKTHAIDLPGFGKSPECAESPEAILRAFIQDEKLSRPVIVGPSMSGRISLDFVLKHPELVGGLVLIGAVGVQERRAQLHKIQVPCLILWGSNDTISPVTNAHILQENIPGAKLRVFDDANHPCYLDETDLWHEELLAFLNTHFA